MGDAVAAVAGGWEGAVFVKSMLTKIGWQKDFADRTRLAFSGFFQKFETLYGGERPGMFTDFAEKDFVKMCLGTFSDFTEKKYDYVYFSLFESQVELNSLKSTYYFVAEKKKDFNSPTNCAVFRVWR